MDERREPPPAAFPIRPIESLTAIRGLLAVWIVVHHFWSDVLALFPSASLGTEIVRRGYLAVPAFFMLSGFVLTHNYGGRGQIVGRSGVVRFLLLRLARIYPVHLVTLSAVALMYGIGVALHRDVTPSGYTLGEFVRNLLLVHTWVPEFELSWNYPSWSISSEWFAYLAFPFFVGRVVPAPMTSSWSMVAFVVTLAASVYVLIGWHPWPFRQLVMVVPTFLSGVVLARGVAARKEGWRSIPRRAPEGLAAAAAIVGLGWAGPSGDAAMMLLLMLLIATLALAGDACSRVWTSRWVLILGAVSYSLYMTHAVAQKALYELMPSKAVAAAAFVERAGLLLAYATFVALTCAAMYRYVEKPSRAWLRARIDTRFPPAVGVVRSVVEGVGPGVSP